MKVNVSNPALSGLMTLTVPKLNGWVCYLYGYGTPLATKLVLSDIQKPPCWFHRKMHKLCFGIVWEYKEV